MWAVRRISKCQAFSTVTFRASCTRFQIASCYFEDKVGLIEPPPAILGESLFLKRFSSSAKGTWTSSLLKHSFSSQAGTKSSGEEDDDLDDGFSELEAASVDTSQETVAEHENDDELTLETEFSEEDNEKAVGGPQNELELSDAETEVDAEVPQQRRDSLALFNAIMAAPGVSVNNALDKWVEEGNDLTKVDISMAMLNFRKRRMYGKALQLSEWLESRKQIEFGERDYASRLDLIAKVRGLQMAESYIEKIPTSFRGEVVYRTLLANCVQSNDVRKSEKVFNKMKDLKFNITSFACNQLILLYKRTDKKKIADVLLLMEKENVKPSLFTYRILIDTKGLSNDIVGMEQIVETMKAEGIEPDVKIQAILAKHYIYGGLNDKAKAVLKEMEGSDLKENRGACSSLLRLYAALGSADDVRRVWKVCESNPRLEESMAAIEAWGKLNMIDEAEAAFSRMSKTVKKLSSKHYSVLLKVYANHKLLLKGKDLVKQMADSGCRIGPLTWDALVKLYVESGEVEKADSILQKAAQQNNVKPMFSSYMIIMDQYAKRGDVHRAEKMFYRMRQAGYTSRLKQFQSLLQAYINAKAPAYGIRERMKADNIFPNKALAAQLAQVDAFKANSVSDLLD